MLVVDLNLSYKLHSYVQLGSLFTHANHLESNPDVF